MPKWMRPTSSSSPTSNPTTAELGLYPQLAALETIVYPTSGELQSANALAQSGTLEISPAESPLTLFVWSKTRILPVRITEFSITEEAFDAALNPIRAKISLGMRVLSVNDLGFGHKGGSLFMAYLQAKERLASLCPRRATAALGIRGSAHELCVSADQPLLRRRDRDSSKSPRAR